MPKVTPKFKIDLTTKCGARVELCEDAAEAFRRAEAYENQGRVFIHPYNDRHVQLVRTPFRTLLARDASDQEATVPTAGANRSAAPLDA